MIARRSDLSAALSSSNPGLKTLFIDDEAPDSKEIDSPSSTPSHNRATPHI